MIVVIPHFFLGACQHIGEGDVNRRRSYEQYQLQLEVLSYSEVASHKSHLQCL
jgi:hypothetical protein